jgi:cytochrome c556
MKLSAKLLVCSLVFTLLAATAYARFANPEEAIRYRKAVMVLIAQHFGHMAAVIKGQSAFNKTEFTRDARLVQTFAALPWEALTTPGSDKGDTDLKSSALTDQPDFMAAADAFEEEAALLVTIAEGGDLGEIKSRFGAVAQSCKACHNQYRR